MNKGGRPSGYNQGMADLICERIADGESLRAICVGDDMPNRSTVFRWLSLEEGFSNQYARAREEQADLLFDETLEIADQYDSSKDKTDVEHIQRAKLRIDTRKWVAGKLRPKKYGDKLQTELSGSISVKSLSDFYADSDG